MRRLIPSRPSFTAALLLAALAATRAAHPQWELEPSNTQVNLRGIHSVDGDIAWASGSNGTVLRTSDGGHSWQPCTTPPGAEKLDFRGIQAFDENTAIVMSSGPGDQSRLYKTTDACRTWNLVFTDPDKDGFWDAVKIDGRRPSTPSANWRLHMPGFLIGDPVGGNFVIFSTEDSGSTWKPWRNDRYEGSARARKSQAIFAASNSAALTSEYLGNLVFVTGGDQDCEFFKLKLYDPFDTGIRRIFDTYRLPMSGGPTSGAFSLAVKGDDPAKLEYVIVGGDYARPESPGTAAFLPSPDYGFLGAKQRTAEKATTPPHGYRSAVAYDPTHNTWITVGPNGTDISRDDGRNWTALKPTANDTKDTDRDWNALSLPFVVGPHGRIGKLRGDALTATHPSPPAKP